MGSSARIAVRCPTRALSVRSSSSYYTSHPLDWAAPVAEYASRKKGKRPKSKHIEEQMDGGFEATGGGRKGEDVAREVGVSKQTRTRNSDCIGDSAYLWELSGVGTGAVLGKKRKVVPNRRAQ